MLLTSLALAALSAVPANSGSIHASLPQRAHVSLTPKSSGCENSPGPYITIEGDLTLSGINARIILTNNDRFTHVAKADTTADIVIIPVGEKIEIPKQPVLGGVGGNPWIYLQFGDCKSLFGKPKRLGRCVQGLSSVDLDFDIPTGAYAGVDSEGCSNSGGPDITLSGELTLGGLCGRLIFSNNAKFTHATAADVVVDIVLIPAGESIVFAKQPPLDGAGGNPHIYVQFLNGQGVEISDYIYVGRCNQL